MPDATEIAVLITCHNRINETLKCLRALHGQHVSFPVRLSVFLTDDGSTDGTAQAVLAEFPGTTVLQGDGNLYWCGGMRLAWQEALDCGGFDYFLWLNNDTYLYQDALAAMVATAETHPGIVVGSSQEPDGGRWSYGGRFTSGGGKSMDSTPLIPSDRPQRCQLMNGNVVLVPRDVVDSIGQLSDSFTHALADFDYGFRALDAGIAITVPPGYQGVCARNPLPAWCDPATPVARRLALFNAPKGIHFSRYMTFCYRHFGFLAVWIGLKAVARVLAPSLWLGRGDAGL